MPQAAAALSRLRFQGHRPVGGDCKTCAIEDGARLVHVSGPSPRRRGLQGEREQQKPRTRQRFRAIAP